MGGGGRWRIKVGGWKWNLACSTWVLKLRRGFKCEEYGFAKITLKRFKSRPARTVNSAEKAANFAEKLKKFYRDYNPL